MPRKPRHLKHIHALAQARRLPASTQPAERSQSAAVVLCSSDDEDIDEYFMADNVFLQDDELNGVLNNVIQWTEGAGNRFRKAYTGDSRATKYRRLAKATARIEIASKCRSITEFCKKSVAAGIRSKNGQ